MAITAIRDFEAEVGSILTAASSAATAARAAFGAAGTRRALSNVRSTLSGLRSDILGARDDLDATDITSLVRYQDGEDLIRLWRWERELRRSLVRLDGHMRVLEAVVVNALEARADKVYVVRSGDTLQSIAARELGDWREWTRLAEVNGLAPGALTSGTHLRIPPRR